MIYKLTRILIVDRNRSQACHIEKMLNGMGYYCIATVSSIEEGLLLSQVGPRRFDVLLAPEHLLPRAADHSFSLAQFEIRHAFIYSRTAQYFFSNPVKGQYCYCSGMPGYGPLEWFMQRALPARAVRSTSLCRPGRSESRHNV